MINGVTITSPNVGVILNGSGNVVQNSIIAGSPNWQAGQDGVVTDSGTGNIVRYNTILDNTTNPGAGPAFALENATANTQIYGNIIDTPQVLLMKHFDGATPAVFEGNLYTGTSDPELIYWYGTSPTETFAQWVGEGQDTGAILADPEFTDAADGNYTPLAGSPAIEAFDPTTGEYVTLDYYGDPRNGLYTIGAIQVNVPEPASASLLLVGLGGLLRRKRR